MSGHTFTICWTVQDLVIIAIIINNISEVPTLTEKMFPMCPVPIVAFILCLRGSHMMTFRSSDPDARRLQNKRHRHKSGRQLLWLVVEVFDGLGWARMG